MSKSGEEALRASADAELRTGEGGDVDATAERETEREEKVLHTRIPESLDREIKRRARNLGMSVSTVVRHVLLHTFDLVEDIVNDSANIAMSITGEEGARSEGPARRAERSARPDGRADQSVLAWQEAILNVNAVCDHCNAVIQKGVEAAIAIYETPGPRTIICKSCLSREAATSPDAGGR